MNSSEHEAFLREIVANPADEAPRLVYADWLQERGDPRGEFIRIQCQLANMSTSAPGRSKLTKRQKELLKQNRQVWTTEGAVAGVRNYEFVRGFIEEARTTVADFVERHQEICERIPLRHLTLTGKVGGERLAHCNSLEQLHTLVLLKNELKPDDLGNFFRSPFTANLERFVCKYSHFPPEVTESLATSGSLTGLRSMEISHAKLDDDRMAPLAESDNFRQLEEANLSTNNHTGACFEGCAWDALKRLDASYCDWDVTGATLFAESRALRGLEVLELSFNFSMTNDGVAAIAQSSHAKDLQAWGLRGCDIQGAAVETIFRSEQLENLKSLDLGGNDLRDDDIQAIAKSPRLKQLEKLLLSHNRLTKSGVDVLLASPHLNPKMKFYLRGNRLTREARKAYREEYGKSFGQFGM